MIQFLALSAALVIDSVFTAIIPVVTIRDGQVGGRVYVTENNKTYYGFLGIPYAAPPVGELRFETPEAPQRWSGILDGTDDSKSCISTEYLFTQDEESEDCLFINVFTPNIKPWSWARLPVMFWIYGGDFVEGNDSKKVYGPDFFMEEDVILVTFNYRLGPLGFLSTGDEVLPGNIGLKDQNFALKWTRENIAYFGGDRDKVTIFGQSAGGASVAAHILSIQSKGLFKAAIVESSSALVPWALDPDPKKYAFKLAEKVGYHGNDSHELKKLLKSKSTREIFDATDYIKLDWPVLEPKDRDSFLTESSYGLLQQGTFNRVPTIIGICSEESISFLLNNVVASAAALTFDLNTDMLIPSDLNPNIVNKLPIVKQIRDLYIKENETFLSNVAGFAEYLSDNMFARGIIKHAELQSAFTPVYLYQFSYYGRYFVPAFIDGAERVGHAAEIPFLFKLEEMNDKDPKNLLAQKRLVKLWSNFAKYDDPTPDASILLDNIRWPKVSPGNLNYLNFNDTLEVRPSLKGRLYSEWEKIFEQYGTKPTLGFRGQLMNWGSPVSGLSLLPAPEMEGPLKKLATRASETLGSNSNRRRPLDPKQDYPSSHIDIFNRW